MARRRDSIPPFEIMGPSAREPRSLRRAGTPGSAGTPAGGAEPQDTGSVDRPEAGGPWTGPGSVLVLRVPRGLAVVAVVAVVLLVVGAYWVGVARGARAERLAIEARLEAQSQTALRPPPTAAGPDRAAPGPGEPAETAGDPRVPGRNYLVLARYPREEARRLAGFLADQGVEAIVVPGHNEGFFHVIATRGFTADQLGGEAYAAYRQRLRQIGRAWKAANDGRGDDLGTMYAQRYDG